MQQKNPKTHPKVIKTIIMLFIGLFCTINLAQADWYDAYNDEKDKNNSLTDRLNTALDTNNALTYKLSQTESSIKETEQDIEATEKTLLTNEELKKALWGGKHPNQNKPNLISELQQKLIAGGTQADGLAGFIEGYQALLYSANSNQALQNAFISVAQPDPTAIKQKKTIEDAIQTDYNTFTKYLYAIDTSVHPQYSVIPHKFNSSYPTDADTSEIKVSTDFDPEILQTANTLLLYKFFDTLSKSCLDNFNPKTGTPPSSGDTTTPSQAASSNNSIQMALHAPKSDTPTQNMVVGCSDTHVKHDPFRPTSIPVSPTEKDSNNQVWFNGFHHDIYYLNQITCEDCLDYDISFKIPESKTAQNAIKMFKHNRELTATTFNAWKSSSPTTKGSALLKEVDGYIKTNITALNTLLIELLTLKYTGAQKQVGASDTSVSANNARTLVHSSYYNNPSDTELFNTLKNNAKKNDPGAAIIFSPETKPHTGKAKEVFTWIKQISNLSTSVGPNPNIDASCDDCQDKVLLPVNGRVLIFAKNSATATVPAIDTWIQEKLIYEMKEAKTEPDNIANIRAGLKSKIAKTLDDMQTQKQNSGTNDPKAALAITALTDIFAQRGVPFQTSISQSKLTTTTVAQLEEMMTTWRMSPHAVDKNGNTWRESIQKEADEKTLKRQMAYMQQEELYLLNQLNKKLETLTAITSTNAVVLMSFNAEQAAKTAKKAMETYIDDYRSANKPGVSTAKQASSQVTSN